MKSKSRRTLDLLFSRPTPANVKWGDVVALFHDLGGELDEREGSRVAVYLFKQVKVLHRPHPSPDMDKGAVASIRKWLEENGVKP
ncbi:type II toxin-antitoxin system HicA family toxin [Pandoraea anhela]|uniref:type II toxin-antitoxin system HicA family toxin n=1 Tax=Pandoraea anhela TaxID=2508295 RepID=UPI00123FB499|nr:type II toxin-antitoxin system HicA family toxin [Pandoraea anhela]